MGGVRRGLQRRHLPAGGAALRAVAHRGRAGVRRLPAGLGELGGGRGRSPGGSAAGRWCRSAIAVMAAGIALTLAGPAAGAFVAGPVRAHRGVLRRARRGQRLGRGPGRGGRSPGRAGGLAVLVLVLRRVVGRRHARRVGPGTAPAGPAVALLAGAATAGGAAAHLLLGRTRSLDAPDPGPPRPPRGQSVAGAPRRRPGRRRRSRRPGAPARCGARAPRRGGAGPWRARCGRAGPLSSGSITSSRVGLVVRVGHRDSVRRRTSCRP